MNRYVIGIDPDGDRSGYGVVDMEKREVVTLGACDFPTLLDPWGVGTGSVRVAKVGIIRVPVKSYSPIKRELFPKKRKVCVLKS